MARTIKHYVVEITDGKGIIKDADGFRVYDVEVSAESEKEIVVMGQRWGNFIIIKKESKYDHDTRMDVESISIQANDYCWGSRVTYNLFTERKVKPDTIKRHIEAKINRKFGFFMHGIDLSCIK
jgi:hypothetical protein